MVNIISFKFNSIRSVIVTEVSRIKYKIDTGSDGNIMSDNIFKILFSVATKQRLENTKDKSVFLKERIKIKHSITSYI